MTATLNIKNKGKLKYSVIPEDMLIRTFNATKVRHDLLGWMMTGPLFPKIKMNQILLHMGALLLQ